jgi:hypothetical protein
MRNLPKKARLFIAAVWLLGARPPPAPPSCPPPAPRPGLGAGRLLLLAILSGAIKVRLMRHAGPEDVASMSLGFALVFASLAALRARGRHDRRRRQHLFSCLYPSASPPTSWPSTWP